MPLSAAARTGLRVAQTGLWADHGSGLWVFRLKGPDSLQSHCTEGPGPAVGGQRPRRERKQSQGRGRGGEEGRKWRGRGGEEGALRSRTDPGSPTGFVVLLAVQSCK